MLCTLLFWPIVVIPLLIFVASFFVAVVALAIEHGVTTNHLRISIRDHGLQFVSSCEYSIGQIEVLNLHSTKHVDILSIRTGVEHTELYDDDEFLGGEGDLLGTMTTTDGSSADCPDLPRQLHSMFEHAVTLQPGQVVLIPIAFFPRFPIMTTTTTTSPLTTNSNRNNNNNSNNNPVYKTSAFQAADWEDILFPARNNRILYRNDDDEDYEHHYPDDSEPPPPAKAYHHHHHHPQQVTSTTVEIDTSRGRVELPLQVTSQRHNLYGLVDMIVFGKRQTLPTTQNLNHHHHDGYPRQRPYRYNDNNPQNHQQNLEQQEVLDEYILEALRPIQESKQRKNRNDIKAVKAITVIPTARSTDNTTRKNESSKPLQPEALSFGRVHLHDRVFQVHDDEGLDDIRTDHECYDVYLNSLPSVSYDVTAVRLTQPQHVSLHIVPGQEAHGTSESGTTPPRLAVQYSGRSTITQWILEGNSINHSFSHNGSLAIPRKSSNDMDDDDVKYSRARRQYVVTVCLRNEGDAVLVEEDDNDVTKDDVSDWSRWLDDDADINSLGMLIIETSQGTILAVALQSAETRSVDPILVVADRLYDQELTPKHISAPPPPLLELANNSSLVNFTFYWSSMRQSTLDISANILSPTAVKIMRASLSLEAPPQRMTRKSHNATTTTNSSLASTNFGVKLRFDNVRLDPLRAGVRNLSIINMTATIDWRHIKSRLTLNATTRIIRGAMILHVTTRTDLRYSEWLDRLHPSDYRTERMMEIPVQINLCSSYKVSLSVNQTNYQVPTFWNVRMWNGKTNMVDAAFFPAYPEITKLPVPLALKYRIDDSYLQGANHRLRVFSNVNNGIALDRAHVKGPNDPTDPFACTNLFDVYAVERNPIEMKRTNPFFNVGLISVRYRFPRPILMNNLQIRPKVCTLLYETLPSSGPHEMPLMIYSGRLAVDTVDPPRTLNTTSPAEAFAKYESMTDPSLVGFDNLLEWFRHSKSGFALRSVINSVASKDTDALRRYLQSLSKSIHLDDRRPTIVSPILINAGAIAQSETETIHIYLTNYNPVPVRVGIDVGEVEGFSIELGVDDSIRTLESRSLLDLLGSLDKKNDSSKASVGRFKGQSIGAIRHFLRTDKLAEKFFERFPYRDDVSRSADAIENVGTVRRQYSEYATARYSSNPTSSRFTGWNACKTDIWPSEYGSFQRKLKLDGRKVPGPLILSSDRRLVRELDVCWFAKGEPMEKISDRRSVTIPPMGKARFDVTVRAPSLAVLEKDITSFVVTGLVLTTDHGETIPVLANFEALRGKLEVSHIPSIVTTYPGPEDHSTIHVPAGLFGSSIKNDFDFVRIPPHSLNALSHLKSGASAVPRNASTVESGVSLYVKSSFHRDIQLKEIVSCNPWFEVSLAGPSTAMAADPLLGTHIGAVSNVVSCDSVAGLPENNTMYPSFYRCALSWVTKRLILQPKGCGSTEMREGRRASVDPTGDVGLKRLVSALKRALFVTEWLDSLSTAAGREINGTLVAPIVKSSRMAEGVISQLLAKTIATARSELKAASETGLLSLGTSFRAVVEYNSTPDESAPLSSTETNRLISLAIRNITVSSVLDIPSLLFKSDSTADRPIIEFPPTHVFDVSSIMIPLRNPTAVPVRIRIGIISNLPGHNKNELFDQVDTSSNPYVHGLKMNEWTPLDYANLQWWEKGGSYFHRDPLGDALRSHHNLTLKYGSGARISMVNPSFSANSAFLLGCGIRCGLKNSPNKDSRRETMVDLAPFSPIGASAAAGTLLRGYRGIEGGLKKNHKLHPLRLHAGGSLYTELKGPANFAISRTALDEIVIPPFSETEVGPILFHPSGRTPRMGCGAFRGHRYLEDCSSQLFEANLYLENSLSGVESLLLKGRALWESVIFVDPDDEEFGHIEFHNGHPTVVFSGSALETREYMFPVPEIIRILVHNDGGTPVSVTLGGLGGVDTNFQDGTCEAGTFRIIDCAEIFPFTLEPNQNKALFIGQFATCARMKEYHKLALNILRYEVDDAPFDDSTRQKQAHRQSEKFRKEQIEINVGYEMPSSALGTCINNFRYPLETKNERANGRSNRVWRRRFPILRVVILVSCVLFLVDKHLNVWVRVIMANVALNRYVRNLKSPEKHTSNWKESYERLTHYNEFPAVDLETMSIERNLEILESRCKVLGIPTPQARSYGNVRSGVGTLKVPPGSRDSSDRRPSTNTDRVRASEGIFGRFNPELDVTPGKLPVQAGWRIGATRGLINSGTFAKGVVKLKTLQLLELRKLAASHRETEHRLLDSLTDGSSIETSFSMDGNHGSRNGDSTDDVPKLIHGPKRIIINNSPDSVSPTVSDSGWVDARMKQPKAPPPQPETPRVKLTVLPTKSSPCTMRKNNTSDNHHRSQTIDIVQNSPTVETNHQQPVHVIVPIPTPPPLIEPQCQRDETPDYSPDIVPDTEEEESERTETPPSPPFRPPPGLAPPPGFGSLPFSLPSVEAPQYLPLEMESPRLLPSFPPDTGLDPFSLGNTNHLNTHGSPSSSRNHVLPESALDEIFPGLNNHHHHHLNTSSAPTPEYDFDVMDFLDGLLDEQQQQQQQQHAVGLNHIPSNPWAAPISMTYGLSNDEAAAALFGTNDDSNNNNNDFFRLEDTSHNDVPTGDSF